MLNNLISNNQSNVMSLNLHAIQVEVLSVYGAYFGKLELSYKYPMFILSSCPEAFQDLSSRNSVPI